MIFLCLWSVLAWEMSDMFVISIIKCYRISLFVIYMHDEYVLNLSFYDLLNVNYIESCIKIAFEMFQDHKMVLESFKIRQKANYVQKGREQAPTRLPQAASRLGTAQTWEQAASRLPPSG